MIADCSDRTDINNSGVYFLVGKSDDQMRDRIYIGESEDVLKRINEHIMKKDQEWQDWSECVIFTSSDDQLNKAKIKYLESSLYTLAIDADRAEVNNQQNPTKSSLSESEIAEMDEYLDNLRLVIGAMGYRFLEPSIETKQRNDETVFFLKSSKAGYDARGMVVDDGFVVLKGSVISDGIGSSFSSSGYNKLRDNLISEGAIQDRVFTKDYLFSSYSAASSVIEGHNSNGWIEWKDKNRKNIDDHVNRSLSV